jgi:hypothetical protein
MHFICAMRDDEAAAAACCRQAKAARPVVIATTADQIKNSFGNFTDTASACDSLEFFRIINLDGD